ncbi:MAG: serine/threonine protein kinase [Acidobacteria bacterium]|nr:serine/threonine protein kinase [Acidobacteriota bacterium]
MNEELWQVFSRARSGARTTEQDRKEAESLIKTLLSRRYLIETFIGRGGMGLIFVARDTEDGRSVVIKMIKSSELKRNLSSTMKRFRREAIGLLQFRHPNIVTILDFDFNNDVAPYIVMEHIDGFTLFEFMKQFPSGLPLDVFMVFMEHLCSAVNLIHENGIVHRDIKPHNMMVEIHEGAFVLKLLDFGLILFQHALNVEGPTSLTNPNEILGTPGYMAPEQCLGHKVTPAADVYNLGLIAFELIVGKAPFVESKLENLLVKHIHEVPPAISKFRDDVPASLGRVIAKSLEKDPSRRQANGQLFWQALRLAAK